MAKDSNTVSAVRAIAEPIAQRLGLEIWDIRFLKEGTGWFLRIFIDKDGGVGIDDCVEMSRALNAPLDEADLIEQAYCLEVSSPGVERQLPQRPNGQRDDADHQTQQQKRNRKHSIFFHIDLRISMNFRDKLGLDRK